MDFFTRLKMRFTCLLCGKFAWRRVRVEYSPGSVEVYPYCLEDEWKIRSLDESSK